MKAWVYLIYSLINSACFTGNLENMTKVFCNDLRAKGLFLFKLYTRKKNDLGEKSLL